MRTLLFCTAISILLLAFFLASAEPAQNAPQTRISLTVAALGPDGVPNTKLKESDFKIIEDGVAQQITGFSSPDAVNNILLILDHNNTWLDDAAGKTATDAWQRVQIALSNF